MAGRTSGVRLPRVNSALLAGVPRQSLLPSNTDSKWRMNEGKGPFLIRQPDKNDLQIAPDLFSHHYPGLRRNHAPSLRRKLKVGPSPFRKKTELDYTRLLEKETIRRQLQIFRTDGVKVQGKALQINKTKSCESSPNRLSRQPSALNVISDHMNPVVYRSSSVSNQSQGRLADIFMSHKAQSNPQFGVLPQGR
jgi:hypothetical protein